MSKPTRDGNPFYFLILNYYISYYIPNANELGNCDSAPLTHMEVSTNQTILMFLSHIYDHIALFYNDF